MRLRSIGSGHRVSWRWGHLADPPLCRATTSGNWRRSTWTSSPGAVAKITASSLAEGPRLTSMRLQNHSSNAPAKYTPGRCRVGALKIDDSCLVPCSPLREACLRATPSVACEEPVVRPAYNWIVSRASGWGRGAAASLLEAGATRARGSPSTASTGPRTKRQRSQAGRLRPSPERLLPRRSRRSASRAAGTARSSAPAGLGSSRRPMQEAEDEDRQRRGFVSAGSFDSGTHAPDAP